MQNAKVSQRFELLKTCPDKAQTKAQAHSFAKHICFRTFEPARLGTIIILKKEESHLLGLAFWEPWGAKENHQSKRIQNFSPALAPKSRGCQRSRLDYPRFLTGTKNLLVWALLLLWLLSCLSTLPCTLWRMFCHIRQTPRRGPLYPPPHPETKLP